jgi:hypothetical protein
VTVVRASYVSVAALRLQRDIGIINPVAIDEQGVANTCSCVDVELNTSGDLVYNISLSIVALILPLRVDVPMSVIKLNEDCATVVFIPIPLQEVVVLQSLLQVNLVFVTPYVVMVGPGRAPVEDTASWALVHQSRSEMKWFLWALTQRNFGREICCRGHLRSCCGTSSGLPFSISSTATAVSSWCGTGRKSGEKERYHNWYRGMEKGEVHGQVRG